MKTREPREAEITVLQQIGMAACEVRKITIRVQAGHITEDEGINELSKLRDKYPEALRGFEDPRREDAS